MKKGERDGARGADPLERALDALLEPPKPSPAGSVASERPAATDPITRLRQQFSDELLPAIERIGDRYSDKGIAVLVQASDFLSGGRTLSVEIAFGAHRTHLEGVVTSDGIAFQESRFVDSVPGVVTGGPMLRSRQLADDGLSQYVYDRIISLVHEAKRAT